MGTITKEFIDSVLNGNSNPTPIPQQPSNAVVPSSPQRPSMTNIETAQSIGRQALQDALAGRISNDAPFSYSVSGAAGIPKLEQNIIPFNEYSRVGYSPNELRDMQRAQDAENAQNISDILGTALRPENNKSAINNNPIKKGSTLVSPFAKQKTPSLVPELDRTIQRPAIVKEQESKTKKLDDQIEKLSKPIYTGDVAVDEATNSMNAETVRELTREKNSIATTDNSDVETNVERFLDPNYKMTDYEKEYADKVFDDYLKNNPKAKDVYNAKDAASSTVASLSMSPEEAEEYARMVTLKQKASTASAFGVHLGQNAPGVKSLADKATQMYADATGADIEKYNLSNQAQQTQTQNPLASMAGDTAYQLGTYAALAPAIQSMPVVGKIAEGAGKVFKNPAVANFVTNVVAGQMADLGLDTLPNAMIPALLEGRYKDILPESLKNQGMNLAFNLLGEGAGAALDAIKGQNIPIQNKPIPELGDDIVEDVVNTAKQADIPAVEEPKNKKPLLSYRMDEAEGKPLTDEVEVKPLVEEGRFQPEPDENVQPVRRPKNLTNEEALEIAEGELKKAQYNNIPIERREELRQAYIDSDFGGYSPDISGETEERFQNVLKSLDEINKLPEGTEKEYIKEQIFKRFEDIEKQQKMLSDLEKNDYADDFIQGAKSNRRGEFGNKLFNTIKTEFNINNDTANEVAQYLPMFDDVLKRVQNAKTVEDLNNALHDATLLYGKVENALKGQQYVEIDPVLQDEVDIFANALRGVTIKIPDNVRADFRDMNIKDFNDAITGFGKKTGKFSKKNGTGIDQLFDELNEATGGRLLSFAEDIGNPDVDATQLQAILDYAAYLKRGMADTYHDYNGGAIDEWKDLVNAEVANANRRIYGGGKIKDETVNIYPYGAGLDGKQPPLKNQKMPEKGTGDSKLSKYRGDSMEKIEELPGGDFDKDNYKYNVFSVDEQRAAGQGRYADKKDPTRSLMGKNTWDEVDARYAQDRWTNLLKAGDEKSLREADRLSRRLSYELREGGRLVQVAAEMDDIASQMNKARQTINQAVDGKYGTGTSEALDNVTLAIEDKLSGLLPMDLQFFGNKEEVAAVVDEMLRKDMRSYAPNNKAMGEKQFRNVNKIVNDIRTGKIKNIDELNDAIYKANGSVKIPAEDQAKIFKLLDEASTLTDGTREQEVALAKAAKLVTQNMPVTFSKKVRGILYTNMLGNFKTAISRNAFGNAAYQGLEQLRNPLAAGIDRLVAKKTGKHTTTGWNKEKAQAYFEGFAKGGKDQLQDIRQGIDTGRSGSMGWVNSLKENTQNWKTNRDFGLKGKAGEAVNKVVNGLGKMANKAEFYVSNAMELGDRPFFEANFAQRKAELNQLIDRYGKEGVAGLAGVPDEMLDDTIDMISAIHAADSVFQKHGHMSKGLSEIRDGLADVSRGVINLDLLSTSASPFTMTPGNMIQRAIEYSPLGLPKNLIGTLKEAKTGSFDQRRFVDELSRTATGLPILGAMGGLAYAGKINGGYSEDPDERAAQQSDGYIEYGLNVGDKTLDTSDIPVLGPFMQAAGAMKEKGITNPEAWGQAAEAITIGSAMQGFRKLFGGDTGYSTSGSIADSLKDTVLSAGTQLVPSLVRQTAQTTDKNKRDLGEYRSAQYYLNNVKNSVPILRQTLPEKYDNEGNPVLQNQGRSVGSKILENFVLPMNVSEYSPSDLTQEAQRLNEVTTDAGGFVPYAKRSDLRKWDEATGKEYSEEQFRDYKKLYGTLNGSVGEKFIKDDIYKNLPDTEKAKALSDIYSAMKEISRKVATGMEVDDKIAKAYMSGKTADEQYKALTEQIEAKYNKYGLDPDYYQTMKDTNADFKPYEGYKEARQLLDINDREAYRKAYADGKLENLQKEVVYQEALKANGLSDSDKNRAAYEADPVNGLQKLVANKQAAMDQGFVTADGKANTAAYDKAVSIMGDDENKLSGYTEIKSQIDAKGYTKEADYLPVLQYTSNTDETKGQYAMMLSGKTPDKLEGGAKAAYDDLGYSGYWLYKELQYLQKDFNNDGKVNKHDRIKQLYEWGYPQGTAQFDLLSELKYK